MKKKLLTMLCLVAILALTGCGTNASNDKADSEPVVQNEQAHAPANELNDAQGNAQGKDNAQVNDQENDSLEGKVYEQSINEPFYYDNKMINSTSIEEGTVPVEMIYSETTTEMLQQFIFKL